MKHPRHATRKKITNRMCSHEVREEKGILQTAREGKKKATGTVTAGTHGGTVEATGKLILSYGTEGELINLVWKET